MRIYLAGPDVFYPDALARSEAMKAACARHGMLGVFPLDPPPAETVIAAEAEADKPVSNDSTAA
jgi:nucleoside 2-deoxyribosyltransferase